jgi:hypothetical protein
MSNVNIRNTNSFFAINKIYLKRARTVEKVSNSNNTQDYVMNKEKEKFLDKCVLNQKLEKEDLDFFNKLSEEDFFDLEEVLYNKMLSWVSHEASRLNYQHIYTRED